MKTEKREAMAIVCCKLKMGPSRPSSLLQMTVWEKNAFGLTKVIDLHLYLNVTLPQVFFKHFASKNQLPGLSIGGTLVENGLNKK